MLRIFQKNQPLIQNHNGWRIRQNPQHSRKKGNGCARIIYQKWWCRHAVGKRVLESVMKKASKATPLTPSKTLNPNTSKKLLPSQWENHWIITGYKKNPLAENFDQHTTAKAVKNGTDLSSKDFPQYISNPSKVNSKPLLPSQPLNLSPKNTPLLTSAQKEAQARVQRYFRNEEIGTKFVKNITTEDGYKALGMYKDKLITFAKNPSKNTIDHEAFHAYFDIALGKQEKKVSWGWCKNAKIWLQKLMQKNRWQIHSLTSWQDEKHKLA